MDTETFVESPNKFNDRGGDTVSSQWKSQYFIMIVSGIMAAVSFIIAVVSLSVQHQCVTVNVPQPAAGRFHF